MNKIFSVLCFSLLLVSSVPICAQSFVEGTHYSRLEQPTESQDKIEPANEVVEYFSFSCPGCYAIESAISALEKSEANLNVRKVHTPFGGKKARYSQKAFAVMTLLKANEHRSKIFNRIHVMQNTFDSDDELVDFFQKLGFESPLVEATLNSFAADMLLRKMNHETKALKIASVPTIIVNSKYTVNIRALRTANDLAALVQYLKGLPY